RGQQHRGDQGPRLRRGWLGGPLPPHRPGRAAARTPEAPRCPRLRAAAYAVVDSLEGAPPRPGSGCVPEPGRGVHLLLRRSRHAVELGQGRRGALVGLSHENLLPEVLHERVLLSRGNRRGGRRVVQDLRVANSITGRNGAQRAIKTYCPFQPGSARMRSSQPLTAGQRARSTPASAPRNTYAEAERSAMLGAAPARNGRADSSSWSRSMSVNARDSTQVTAPAGAVSNPRR